MVGLALFLALALQAASVPGLAMAAETGKGSMFTIWLPAVVERVGTSGDMVAVPTMV